MAQVKIRDITYPTQEVNSVEAKNVAEQNEWNNKVAIPNPTVQSDATKVKVETTVKVKTTVPATPPTPLK